MEIALEKKGSRFQELAGRVWSFCREQPLGAIGILFLFVLIILALAAPLLTKASPYQTDVIHATTGPSKEFWFGTDNMGRDMFSRWVWGSRMSLIVAICSIVSASVLGGLIGIVSGLIGRKTDAVVQRVMDVMMALPSIVIAIIIMAALGTSVTNLIVAIAVSFIPRINRMTRAVAISLKESLYVESASVAGATRLRVALHHILPNCIAPWLVYSSALLATAFLAEASLSFLGLGVPRPEPSWGRDLSENINRFQVAPWLCIFPGIGISMAVFGANFVGDAMRNVLDPRLKKI
jgi:peptide/nickel transport system permease protein